MKTSATVQKYLDNYAENEHRALAHLNQTFTNVITIPAFDETIENIKAIFSAISAKKLLVILVVNASNHSTDAAKESNQKLLADINAEFLTTWRSQNQPGITLHSTAFGGLLLVDRSSPAQVLPEKSGVGLARKIAADLALKMIVDGKVSSTWIHCTDADAQLPQDYFQKTATATGCAAALHPYTHRIHSENSCHHDAVLLYELSLRHYVIGLNAAHSSYGYQSIGSTLSIDCAAYAAVRGFPRREAGEDFYLLNKINKIGKIQQLDGEPIILDGRFSHRVPFGTGKSVEKITALDESENHFLFYHPEIFDLLKMTLQKLAILDQETTISPLTTDFMGTEKAQHLNAALTHMGASSAMETARKSSQNPRIQQEHLRTWFDGFRTLKFIHYCRDLGYPSMPLRQLITQPLYRPYALNPCASLTELNEQFKKIERHLTTHRK